MKKLYMILLVLFWIGLIAAKVDLNTATLDELRQLPITEQQARDIYEYRMFVKIFGNIFELRDIP
ncbi:MAG TPA: helix-hairpin-helix domain-containing protein, partial [Candidatus Cloacimonadota bacterium]|nr:helix-hairpin-helix domain-containing protein [Candidatus Cloacimonadota bacterium]